MRSDDSMHRTYELYFRRDETVTFHPLTCRPHEVVPRAAALLDDNGAEEVEVREAGQALFTLTA